MPGRIRVLPTETADRIAAGEVVERPSSIVKELLENALDSGATDIVVELERGGTRLIKVVDNGGGIDGEDVPLAFERHATSKISAFEDLYEVSSFGFRGEALPSIASVAKMEMVTRKKEALSGRKVRLEGGAIRENHEIGCPVGTSVTVTDIFAAVPVRKKFLKRDSAEQALCLEVITKTMLPHCRVRVRVTADGKPLLNIPATENLSERITLVLGIDGQDKLLPVERKRGSVRLRGFLSRPDFTRSTSKGILAYVNGRYVKDALISHAVMTAYRRLIEARRYPQAVLFIDLPSGDVDVNVHPAKLEVRFRSPREVYEAVLFTVAGALATSAGRMEKAQPAQPVDYEKTVFPEFRGKVAEAMRRYAARGGGHPESAAVPPAVWEPVERKTAPAAGMEEADRPGFFSSLDYLGQIENTYLIFAEPRGIVLVDQHAAHERVLFERLRAEAGTGALQSQQLLLPEIMNLSPPLLSLLSGALPFFAEMGIQLEPFGGDAIRVHSFPILLAHLDPKSVIVDLLEEMEEMRKSPDIKAFREKLFTVMACKGAVKAREGLTRGEVDRLCRDLDAIPFATHCPHGRPLYVHFGVKDLEKMFKRS